MSNSWYSSRGVPYHGRCNPCLLDLFQHLITVFHEGFHLAQNLFVPIADPHLRPGLYSVREDQLVFKLLAVARMIHFLVAMSLSVSLPPQLSLRGHDDGDDVVDPLDGDHGDHLSRVPVVVAGGG